MDLSPEALAFLDRSPHGVRYRQLLDPSHPDHNPAYFAVVEAKARGQKPPTVANQVTPIDAEEEKRRRRAGKMRLPLGVKPPPGKR